MESNIVSVMLWGEEVGKLYWDNRGKRAVFSFNPDFVKKGIDIAPLTASTKGAAGNGFPVVGDKRKLYQGLPPFLADSLPDHWGNKVFEHQTREYTQAPYHTAFFLQKEHRHPAPKTILLYRF